MTDSMLKIFSGSDGEEAEAINFLVYILSLHDTKIVARKTKDDIYLVFTAWQLELLNI
jgi:hypothetical protein